MEQAPSTGKTVAIGGFSSASGIVLLLYIAKHVGLDDMTPDVAAAIIGFGIGGAAMIMHREQRKKENEQVNQAGGVIGGPGA